MKITDRMCNVTCEGLSFNGKAKGVFKEHPQPTTDSDYSVPGYCTLSISYDDYYSIFEAHRPPKPRSLQGDAKHVIGCSLEVSYEGDWYAPNDWGSQHYRQFAVRAVTMARNYRTHEIDHVVLTLEEMNASYAWGGN